MIVGNTAFEFIFLICTQNHQLRIIDNDIIQQNDINEYQNKK